MIKVECSGRFPSVFSQEEAEALIAKSLKLAGHSGSATVSLAIVNDLEIRRLNREWRGENRVTDVLSFNYPKSGGPVGGKGMVLHLGEIVISLPTVRRQAKANRRTVREEMSLMTVHGCLHLLRLDHDTAAKEKRMFRLQQDILITTHYF